MNLWDTCSTSIVTWGSTLLGLAIGCFIGIKFSVIYIKEHYELKPKEMGDND